MPERSSESPIDERQCTPPSDTNKALGIADRYMLVGSLLIGATMRTKVESVGKTGSVSIDKTNTIPHGTRYEMQSTYAKEQDFEALSGQLGCRASEPARNTEDVEDLTAPLGIEPEAESR